jgi:pimeloyl-ACP methyl ester carboxylesterase
VTEGQSIGNRATFVLVHGGGHGGWCWKPVARLLRDRGHDVYTPTLTGFGERSHVAVAVSGDGDGVGVRFETFVTDVESVLWFEDLHDVVLVGHSMGGVVIPRVAEKVADRLRRVVWLAAAVTADGETLIDAVPQSPAVARAVRIGPDGSAETDHEAILDAIVQDGTPEQRRFVGERHRSYPPHALTEPGRLSAFLAIGLPTGYIVAADDLTIERPVAEAFADRLPGCRRATIPGSHDCMITRPAEVAAALESMA